MKNSNFNEWLKASIIRAIWTMAQVALSMLTIGATTSEIDWSNLISVMAVAGVYSILKSIAVGVPEAYRDGTLMIDTSDPETDLYRIVVDGDLANLEDKKQVIFSIDSKAKLK